MGDEMGAVTGAAFLVDGVPVPVGATMVSLAPDGPCRDASEIPASWGGIATAEFDMACSAMEALMAGAERVEMAAREFSLVLEMAVPDACAPGPSRFMRLRRAHQCRRGQRDRNREARKLSRVRRHRVRRRMRLVLPRCVSSGIERSGVIEISTAGT